MVNTFANLLPTRPNAKRPLMAVGYGPRCVPVMQLVEAAAGICDLLWLVDGSLPEMEEMKALLGRFGAVVDRSGLSEAEFADLVRAHEPTGMVTYLDAGMVELALLAEAIGLEFYSPITAKCLVDKAEQRHRLALAGLKMPRCRVLAPGLSDETRAQLADQVWPAIIKPRSAQGSRFTFQVSSFS